MNATAINVASLGAARDDFETNAENWPPNVKAAHDKPSPTSAHLGLELLAVDKAGGTVEMAFNASDKLCNKWGGIQGGNVAAMLDDAMAFAIGLNLDWGQISPTLELKYPCWLRRAPGGYTLSGRWCGAVARSVLSRACSMMARGNYWPLAHRPPISLR